MIQNLSNTTGTGVWCGKGRDYYKCKSFTLAAWIIRKGTGTTVTMGTGGQTAIEPIIAGGIGESETVGLNVAFCLGYIPASSKIGADFEDRNNGLNHPHTSTGTVLNNTASHICVTYNHSSSLNTGSYAMYIDGVLDITSLVTNTNALIRIPDTGSAQGVGIGIAINSSMTKTGAFFGAITDCAIWNTALSASEVSQLATSRLKGMPLQIRPASLEAYWPLDETPDRQGASPLTSSFIDRSGNNHHGTRNLGVSGSAETFLSYL